MLNLLKPRFLASLRNDTKMNCDTVSYERGTEGVPKDRPMGSPEVILEVFVQLRFNYGKFCQDAE